MEETAGAPSSFAALSPRRLRASSRDGGGVVNRPPSPLTMLLSRHTRRREVIAALAARRRGRSRRARSSRPSGRGASVFSADERWPPIDSLKQGLRNLGYVEGQNLEIVYRFAAGQAERYPDLAAELVALPVELIVTLGTPASVGRQASNRGHSNRGANGRPCRRRSRSQSGSSRRQRHRVLRAGRRRGRETIGAAQGVASVLCRA